jgi:hypothetical protein
VLLVSGGCNVFSAAQSQTRSKLLLKPTLKLTFFGRAR